METMRRQAFGRAPEASDPLDDAARATKTTKSDQEPYTALVA